MIITLQILHKILQIRLVIQITEIMRMRAVIAHRIQIKEIQRIITLQRLHLVTQITEADLEGILITALQITAPRIIAITPAQITLITVIPIIPVQITARVIPAIQIIIALVA